MRQIWNINKIPSLVLSYSPTHSEYTAQGQQAKYELLQLKLSENV